MINYETEFGGERKWPGLSNEALPKTKREGHVARAAFLAGQLRSDNWQRPDIDACEAYPGDELPDA